MAHEQGGRYWRASPDGHHLQLWSGHWLNTTELNDPDPETLLVVGTVAPTSPPWNTTDLSDAVTFMLLFRRPLNVMLGSVALTGLFLTIITYFAWPTVVDTVLTATLALLLFAPLVHRNLQRQSNRTLHRLKRRASRPSL